MIRSNGTLGGSADAAERTCAKRVRSVLAACTLSPAIMTVRSTLRQRARTQLRRPKGAGSNRNQEQRRNDRPGQERSSNPKDNFHVIELRRRTGKRDSTGP
jgi:hypothetical protein